MKAAVGNKPWRPTLGASVGRKGSDDVESKKAEQLDCVISRDEFLAGRVWSLQNKQDTNGRYNLRTEKAVIVSPSIRPSPPPGLELPQDLEPLPSEATAGKAGNDSSVEKQPVANLPAPEPETYKVLLQNLPEAMLKECMLRAMLEQAKLGDVKHLAFRSNGKALITFATPASVRQCISHFHGRQWGGSNVPVTAMYVRLADSAKTPSLNAVLQKPMSVDAPAFVPGSKNLCADAPVFVPSSDKVCGRDRTFSYASTDVGPDNASDGGDSEVEAPVACT